MKQKLDHLVSGLSVLLSLGMVACSSSDSGGSLLPGATTIDVDDVILSEGDSGSTAFDFTVSLSEPVDGVVTVSYSTADGTAQNEAGDGDYQSISGMLTFDPGTTSQVVTVFVNGDLQKEADETFTIVLATAAGPDVQIGDGEGAGTILDQDAAFSVHDANVTESDATSILDFVVELESPLDETVYVDYATNDGTAHGSFVQGDYAPVSGTLTFDPGVTQQTVTVQVYGDFLGEFDENFTVDLTNAQGPGASIADAQGIGTIEDDDREVQVDGDSITASWRPHFAASGSFLYVAWHDDRNGASDVYFRYSANGGASWSETESRLDTDTAGSAASTNVRVAADGNNVYVAWIDDRNGGSDVYFNYSTDNGQNWQVSDFRLDTDAAGAASSFDVELACSGDEVYAVWIDERDGAGDVYFNFSADGGANWQANDIRLDTSAAGSSPSSQPQIAVGDHVNVVWNENDDIYSNYSADGGASWQGSQIRVDKDPSIFPNAAGSPRLAVDATNVYVVWQDERNGFADIYFNQSFDGGANFGPADKRLDNGDLPGFRPSVAPEICAEGFDVYVVWQDRRQLDPSFDDIYFNRSADGGITWFGDRRIDYGITAGKAQAETPVIDCEGQNLVIAWSDLRGGPEFDLYATTSVDGGESFRSRCRRLDSDPAGSAASVHPQALVHDGQVHVIWEDHRTAGDVFHQTFAPH